MRENLFRHFVYAEDDQVGELAYTEDFRVTFLTANQTLDVEQPNVSAKVMSLNGSRVARVALCGLTHAIQAFSALKFELILFKSTVKLNVLYFKVIVLSTRSLRDDRAVFSQVDFLIV